MQTLIIPDIHNRTENAEHWLTTQRYERVVFLGDYFDSFEDDVNDARLTATWLRDRIERTDDIFLLGNHDVPYMFPRAAELYCPGFTPAKAKGIGEILKPRHWQRFRLAHAEQGWLMSHAGFHPVWIKEPTVERILERCDTAIQKAKRRVVDPILGDGEVPGGLQRFGGPLWMDWDSLMPIPGINQIVGHSEGDDVREKITPESRNYCLDVRGGSAAALLSEREVTILRRG